MYLGKHRYIAATLGAGRFPLWNPFEFCGYPLHGAGQGSVLYPPAVLTAEHPGLPLFGSVPDRLTAFLHAWATPVARFRAFDPERITGSLFDPTDANYLPLRGFRPIERPGPSITVWRVQGRARHGRRARCRTPA